MSRWPRTSRGVSLIELMVGLALGLVVVGASTLLYLNSAQIAREQSARARLSDSGQLLLTMLARDVALAGYAEPARLLDSSGRFDAGTPVTQPIFACNNSFTDAARGLADDLESAVHCRNSGSGGMGLSISYVATAHNALISAATPSSPTNCAGSRLNSAGAATALARHRYYVERSSSTQRFELYCKSPGINAQSLAENVERLAVSLGMAENTSSRHIVRVVAPDAVLDWALVRSVRVCVELVSHEPVSPPGLARPYLACDGTSAASTDGRLRQSFMTTVALRNRSNPL